MFDVEKSIAKAEEELKRMADYVRTEAQSQDAYAVERRLFDESRRVGRMTYEEATGEMEQLFGFRLYKHNVENMAPEIARDADAYYEANRNWMRYDEYIAAGYPIGSGAVDGACRHLVKDRMEGSGMRWTVATDKKRSRNGVRERPRPNPKRALAGSGPVSTPTARVPNGACASTSPS